MKPLYVHVVYVRVIIACVACALASGALAGTTGCWVDLFGEPNFKGIQTRISGPTELPNLRNIHDIDWNDVIDSLEVGPEAEVEVYKNENYVVPQGPIYHAPEIKAWGNVDENYRASVMTFTAHHRVHHLGEYDFHNQISSLKVKCIR